MALNKQNLANALEDLLLPNSLATINGLNSEFITPQEKEQLITEATNKILGLTNGAATAVDNYTKGGYNEGNTTNQYLKWDTTENKYIPLTATDFKTELGIIESDAPESGGSTLFVSETEPEDAVENDIWIKI